MLAVEQWLAPPAGDVVLSLLLGDEDGAARVNELGWSQARALRKTTDREPLTAEESARLERLGVRWLALG